MEFYRRAARVDGLQPFCKSCVKRLQADRYLRRRNEILAANKRWRDANKDRIFDNRLRTSFGIDRAKYDAMLLAQGGVCFFCKQPERTRHANGTVWNLTIDHDHTCCPQAARSCGRCVRWLVCNRCNVLLAQANDDSELLRSIARALDVRKGLYPREAPCLTA